MKIWSTCPYCDKRNETELVGHTDRGSAIVRCWHEKAVMRVGMIIPILEKTGCNKRYIADWTLKPEVTTIKLES